MAQQSRMHGWARSWALVASWDMSMNSQPIWAWPSGLRLSRFFTAIR